MSLRMQLLLYAVLSPCSLAAATTDAMVDLFPAFPGAEGAGAYTPGGRGGQVLAVTTLEDFEPGKEKPILGSLRAAVLTKGPRIILFHCAGTIDLKRNLEIGEPFVTIAGQSAPDGGICLKGSSLVIKTRDVVVRHLRVRPGDIQNRELDCISCSGRNIILDHCSASWGIDETISTNGDSGNVTVQWCIVAESLNSSHHHKGEHGYGSLISGPEPISYHHNIYAFHRSRNPRGGDVLLDFRNNLIYGWKDRAGYSGDDRLFMNYVSNNLVPLEYSRNAEFAFKAGGLRQKIFITGNQHASDADATRDNTRLIRPPDGATNEDVRAKVVAEREFPVATVTTQPADAAYQRILEEVGAVLPARDSVDERVLGLIQSRNGKLINSQKEVGGWPELGAGGIVVDSDKDYFPDGWETKHGFDPNVANDSSNDTDKDGYTDIEEYLNNSDPNIADPWIYPPRIESSAGADFIDATTVTLASKISGNDPKVEIRYTLDGTEPTRNASPYEGPFSLQHSAILRAKAFAAGVESHVRNLTLNRHELRAPTKIATIEPGLQYEYFESEDPELETLPAGPPMSDGMVPSFSLDPRKREERFGIRFRGLFQAETDGIYSFTLRCSPRGELRIGEDAVVESKGRRREHSGSIALCRGLHPISFEIYYKNPDDKTFELKVACPEGKSLPIPSSALYHVSAP